MLLLFFWLAIAAAVAASAVSVTDVKGSVAASPA